MKNLLIVNVILLFTYICDSARILGIFHMPAHSHHVVERRLMRELARKGHDITVISGYIQKPPLKNYKVVELPGFVEALEEQQKYSYNEEELDFISAEILLNSFLLDLTEQVLNQNTVQELLKTDEKFDVVIIEEFMSYALKGICYHFNAPCIIISSIGVSRFINSQVGNPSSPAYATDFSVPYGSNMNFLERLHNSCIGLFAELYKHLYIFPQHNKLLQKFFPGAPHVTKLHYNVSLALVNGHVSSQQAVPIVPNIIEIGGFHVETPKKLPQDLQEYLDNANEGVVYFSMGSNLRSADMPKDKLKAILSAFSQLKQKVLWKWEANDLPDKPANVKIVKWLPQADILAHSNIRLFVTHGGLLSTIEAIYHGVPVVGIPIYGDQRMNLANAVNNEFGLSVPYSTLNQDDLLFAMQEVLNNPKYLKNIKQRSKIMHDQPMKPLDKAVFWIEYVIRHRGAPHLRSAALDLAWYQYLLLDVALVVFTTALFVILIFFFFVSKLICNKTHKQKSKGKKKDN